MIDRMRGLAGRLAPGRRDRAAGLAGLVLGGVLGFGLIVWSNRGQPVTINSAYELDGVARRGGHIDIVFDVDRIRDCPTETSRWLWTWVDHDGQRVKQYFPLPNTSTSLTDLGRGQRFIVSFPLPAGVWAGDWFYWAKSVQHCSILPAIFRFQIVETPEIPVRISE